MLQFSQDTEVRASVILGTVREVIGQSGYVEFEPRNFVGTARLIVHLVKANGGKEKVFCSPTVSKLFRRKEMSLGELLSLNLCEEESGSGDLINVIEMPKTDQKRIRFAVDEVEETEFVPEEVDFVPSKRILL